MTADLKRKTWGEWSGRVWDGMDAAKVEVSGERWPAFWIVTHLMFPICWH